jgi:N-acyl-D-aspartate/D-glutamate deacylase
MRDGAWGFCTGLIYTPGSYAKTDELIELAKVAARHGGFYASHIRGEGTDVLVAVQEALDIGAKGGLPVHISHVKAAGQKAWGKSADIIALLQAARAKGQHVTADQYPYTASSTSLAATVIPVRYREGSQQDLIARFDDPRHGPTLRQAIARALAGRDGGQSIFIATYKPKPAWQGKSLAAIAPSELREPLDIVLEIERHGGAGIVNFSMNEEDVRLLMKQPFVATASDGSAKVPNDTVPHPRNYGTFPRKIGRYGLAEHVVSLEQALRSATGLPADILRLPERGYLKVGNYADVVVFDPKTFRDTATFEKPHQYATGVRYLFVNGALTIDKGEYNGTLAGKALRHPARVQD